MAIYKDYGFTHNQAAHTFKYLLTPVLSFLGNDKKRTILDLGCGNGYLVSYLLQEGYNAYGTDASEKGIAIAKQEHPDRFFLQDLSTGKLPDELQTLAFDTILSTEVIEHLYDPEGFIDFCRDQLTKGGELIITTPYHGYLKNLGLSLFNKWDGHLDPLWYGGHIKMWSRATLSKLLEKKGFEVVNFQGCGRIPYFWKSMIIKVQLR